MASNIIDSFFVALGFEIDDKGLSEFQRRIDGASESMMTMVKVGATAAAAVGLFVERIATSLDDLGDFAERNGVAAEMIQELGHAAQLNGSSIEAVKSSVVGLNSIIGQAALGVGRGAKMFEALGFAAKNADGSIKSVDQVLAEVAERMQGLSRQESLAMAGRLGIDPTLVPMLLKGRDAIEELRAEARAFGIATENDTRIAGEFKDGMDRMIAVIKGLSKAVAVSLMPAMTQMIDSAREWLMQNREIIKSGIDTFMALFGALLARVWAIVVGLASAVASLVRWMFETKTGLVALVAALGLLTKMAVYQFFMLAASAVRLFAGALTVANAAALITSALIGALILGIALLIDDWLAWKDGADSVIGDLVKKFPALGQALQAIEDTVRAVGAFFVETFGGLGGSVGELLGALWNLATTLAELIWPVLRTVLKGWGLLLGELLPVLAKIVAAITGGIVGAITAVLNTITAMINKVRSMVEGIVGFAISAAQKVGKLLGLNSADMQANISAVSGMQTFGGEFAAAGPLGKAGDVSNTSAVTKNTTTIQAPITVNSPDPERAGQSVRRELERMNKATIRNGNSAVAY